MLLCSGELSTPDLETACTNPSARAIVSKNSARSYTGLLLRRDSPNGKRYVRKHGEERVAFRFDLSPLFCLSEEIARAAKTVRKREERLRRLRESVSLMRRDLAALAEFPGLSLWDQLRDTAVLAARALRRKLSLDDLNEYWTEIGDLLELARNLIDGPETEEMITSDARSERHHLNSNTECIDLEPAFEKAGAACNAPETQKDKAGVEDPCMPRMPRIPLNLVIAACPSLKTFYQSDIRHWHQLFDAACHVRPAMGISPSAWDEAQRCMGPEQASIVVVAMLERFADIASPGGTCVR